MIDEMKEHIGADQLIDDLYYAIGKIEMFKALRYIKRVRDMPLSSYVENDDE
jgi:glucose uptake protein GlcU